MIYYTKTVEQTLKEIGVSDKGLSNIEYRERLLEYGPNSIVVRGDPLWRKIVEPFANVFMVVLFIAAIISIVSHSLVDGVIIFAIMAVTATIYYVQRFSTDRILRSLQKRNTHKVEVWRDGKPVIIEASELVPGDVISLGEGDKVPADCRLLKVSSLRVDEAQLTGESVPISKQIDALGRDKEVYEQSNMVFQGSFIVGGEAMALVVATGNDTEFGRLAALSSEVSDKSPVQKKIDILVKQIIVAVAILAVFAFALAVYRGMDLDDSLRFVIAFSVSAVPESLAVAISVVLVLGMRRMAIKKALVRSMSAIETVGTLTTIATDKTGTLTKNLLTVQATWTFDNDEDRLTRTVARAVNIGKKKVHDPLDTALANHLTTRGGQSKYTVEPVTIFPFDQAVSMSGNLWKESGSLNLYLKGAPEGVLRLSKLSVSERAQAELKLQEMTSSGLRVIALAHIDDVGHIEKLTELHGKKKLVFDGFIAVADILRKEARPAIATALRAGVTVRMITGDHFETAFHIGRQLGLVTSRSQVFDSRKMNEMSDEDLEIAVRDVRVFSRVVPENKYRILAILKKDNITAMTGDGVNDVPALTNAHVGVAMGSGASIAKDAGDIILIDDNFKSIVNAIHEGRTIYANIKRMVVYLLATNIGEVMVALGSLLLAMPVTLLPVQILWVNLVTDSAMVIPLGLEPGEKRNMKRKPQRSDAPLLSRFMISRIILIAVTMAVVVLGMYAYYSGQNDFDYGRTIAFSALVVMQWSSAFCARSDYESLWTRIRRFNPAFYIGLSVAVILQLLVMFGPLGGLLHITPVELWDVIWTGLIAFFAPVVVVEIHKYIGRRYFNKGSRAKIS
jgi:P-type Ca2+ transporter type 2C